MTKAEKKRYEMLNSNKDYSLLKVNIKTGRKNQPYPMITSHG